MDYLGPPAFHHITLPPYDIAGHFDHYDGFPMDLDSENFVRDRRVNKIGHWNSSGASVMTGWVFNDSAKLTSKDWSNNKDADGGMSRTWGMWPSMMFTDIPLVLLVIMVGHSLCLPSSLWSASSPSPVSNVACFSSVGCDGNTSALKPGGLPATTAYRSVFPMQSR